MFEESVIPLDVWVSHFVDWLVENYRHIFQAIKWPVETTLNGFDHGLNALPPLLVIAVVVFAAWRFSGIGLALFTAVTMVLIGLLGMWADTMTTLAMVLSAVLFCALAGIPLGIWAGRSDRFEAMLRPVLDAMQTTPAFVYLVPVVMLFGIGNVPGVVVTIVFALPPLIRLTNLGIRGVREDLIEATRAFGASPWQLLTKVQLPLAMPTIMAGINQTLMLALSMVVIASMIAVGGLGQMVLRGIGRLDMGLATVGGLGIVILAILLDRITQAMAKAERKSGRWYESGPLGLLIALSRRSDSGKTSGPATQRP
jgi:glycine betaine/proline transport system permease protein